jgi:hypothetical protein
VKGKNESDLSLGSEDALPAKVLRTVVGGNRPEEPKNVDVDIAAAMTAGTSEAGDHGTFWQSLIPPEVRQCSVERGPLHTAAVERDALADERATSAAGYKSIVDPLVDERWAGASSTAMLAAIAPYTSWMNAAGDQAMKAAEQAQAAVAAYEKAYLATVDPTTVQQSREMLVKAVSDNLFGYNANLIKETEDRLNEMFNMPLPIDYSLGGSDQEPAQAPHDAALSHQAKDDDAPPSHQETAGKEAPDITASRRR